MNNKYYKKYIQKLISTNPTVIDITRIEKIPDGYGGYTEKPIRTVATVTFYEKQARREFVSESGTTYTGVNVTKVLADDSTDLQKDDTITAAGVKYKVLLVKEYFDICKQVEVEVVGDGVQDN